MLYFKLCGYDYLTELLLLSTGTSYAKFHKPQGVVDLVHNYVLIFYSVIDISLLHIIIITIVSVTSKSYYYY